MQVMTIFFSCGWKIFSKKQPRQKLLLDESDRGVLKKEIAFQRRLDIVKNPFTVGNEK
jgi:hypothetical protein